MLFFFYSVLERKTKSMSALITFQKLKPAQKVGILLLALLVLGVIGYGVSKLMKSDDSSSPSTPPTAPPTQPPKQYSCGLPADVDRSKCRADIGCMWVYSDKPEDGRCTTRVITQVKDCPSKGDVHRCNKNNDQCQWVDGVCITRPL